MTQPLEHLPLFAEEKPRPPEAEAADGPRRAGLWIAVHWPALAGGPGGPGEAGEGGLPAPIESLAVWADRITPLASLAPPDGLLLEVRGSLKLLGGLEAIEHALAEEIEKRRETCRLCAAPTPLGALWLARARSADVLDPDGLRAAVGRLPLETTAWPEHVRALLEELGLRRVGDCLRLPRDGFARRVGRAYLQDLDKALGRAPDPRIPFRQPVELGRSVELAAESTDVTMLRRALERLLEEIVAGLRRHQRQARELEIVLHHKGRPPTVERLEWVRPVHEKSRFLEPLLIGLEQLALPAPVVAVSLRADSIQPMRIESGALFAQPRAGGERDDRAVLLDCLRERFGPAGVQGLALVADHRPERAWAGTRATWQGARGSAAPGERRPAPGSPWAHRRPLWLLPEPLPLADGLARFRYRRIVHREAGPERIESGWWDETPVARDYYTAITAQGERLWVYRERATRAWYLHGIFG